MTPHPSYNQQEGYDNDAIVFKLQRKVDYGILPNVFPACWPSKMPEKGEVVRNLSQSSYNSARQLNTVSYLSGNSFWIWDNVIRWRTFSYFERGQF